MSNINAEKNEIEHNILQKFHYFCQIAEKTFHIDEELSRYYISQLHLLKHYFQSFFQQKQYDLKDVEPLYCDQCFTLLLSILPILSSFL